MDQSHELTQILEACKRDPLLFVRHVLGVHLTKDQEEIFQLVWNNPKVAVPSGHTVGKSFLSAVIVLAFLYLHRNSKIITTSKSFQQCLRVLWANIRKLHGEAKIPLGGQLNKGELNLGPDWFAIAVANDNPDAFQGYHAQDILVIFDECQTIDREIWEATESICSSENSHWLAISNPTQLSSQFYEVCNNDPEWSVKRLSCLDHPNVLEQRMVVPGAVKPDWPAKMAELWGDDSPEYASRVLGEFPTQDDGTLITVDMLRKALEINRPIEDGLHMGVDLARFGDDKSVVTILDNGTVIAMYKWSQCDLMESCGKVIHYMKKYKVNPENVHVDVIGLGAGLVDRMYELNYPVEGVNVGEGVKGDWSEFTADTEFRNRRAELWWVAATLLRRGHLVVPEEFKDIWTDLKDLRYKFDSRGKILMESKDKLKSRTGKSPDYGDSLILALSRANSSIGIHII